MEAIWEVATRRKRDLCQHTFKEDAHSHEKADLSLLRRNQVQHAMSMRKVMICQCVRAPKVQLSESPFWGKLLRQGCIPWLAKI